MIRFLPIILIAASSAVSAQPSDFIVLKNRNNRTIKSYFPGAYISAATYTGATLDGIIKVIRNDSVYIEQHNVVQVPTQFGTPALDTIVYMIKLHYEEIRAFYYRTLSSGRTMRRTFVGGKLPRIMGYGGTGFILLELINSAYRHESLNDGNKLKVLAIAAGVAATGLLWLHFQNRESNRPDKYKVVYIHMNTKKAF